MYGAGNVEYALKAKSQLDRIDQLGLGDLAVCIAKTQKSLSDDPSKKRTTCRIYCQDKGGGAFLRSRIYCAYCRNNNENAGSSCSSLS